MIGVRVISKESKSFFRYFASATAASRKRSDKLFASSAEAWYDLKDGASITFSGFGTCGIPENSIKAIQKKGTKDITAYSNDAGIQDFGLGVLISSGQISKLVASYVGEHKTIAKELLAGKLELELTPQGTLAEKFRAGGAGIPAFYTPTGVGTVVQEGKFPIRYFPDGTIAKYSQPKEVRVFNGTKYVLEESIISDYAAIKAWKADPAGNLVFRSTARNFNPDCARCAKTTVVEVEEIVPLGSLKPDEIHLPGIYVHRIYKGDVFEKRIEKLTYHDPAAAAAGPVPKHSMDKRNRIAERAAQEFEDGMYVNLGIGIPTVASNYIPKGMNVVLQSENGLLGTGPYPLKGEEDPDLINAGKETVTYTLGSSTFCSSDSFAMIRGRKIDLTILGCLEVSQNGDLASWIIPGKTIKGMGGAMDLVSSCPKIIVTTTHTDKYGKSKVLDQCRLPLTGKGVVDMIITELAVFVVDSVHNTGLTLVEIAEGVSLAEVEAKTEAKFKVAEHLKTF